jgi:hypothetical protein
MCGCRQESLGMGRQKELMSIARVDTNEEIREKLPCLF